MATYRRHTSAAGNKTTTACVRITGFAPAAKTFATMREAEQWAADTEELLRAQKKRVRRDVAQLTVGDLLLEYLRDPDTLVQRRLHMVQQICGHWIAQLGTVKALDLNVLTLREKRDALMKGRKPATVNRYLSVLRSAWNWARVSGLIPTERRWPERLVLTEPAGRVRFLSDDELAELLKIAAAHSVTMHTAILVSIASGLRQSELLALDWSDIDLARAVVSVRRSKNDTPRKVHLTANAVAALEALRGSQKVRAIGGAVFVDKHGTRLKKTTLEGRWRKLRALARLKNFRWHDLRHTCASLLAQNGATLLMISEVLGHRSFAMTQRYSHLVQGAALPAHAALDAKLAKPNESPRGP